MNMARKSRKNLSPVVNEEYSFAGWRAAVYVRLSVEDTRTRTDSIETQQMIIREFLEDHRDIQVIDTYIDNGTTGTNFQRPAFQRMLDDIESSKVNCVIVKDLSRLGRNSIDTGYYIERYFPGKKVRFIAVNENYDTEMEHSEQDALMIPLRNMINEAYSIDIGKKIKAQQRQAMKDGKFIGARAPYGYLKSPDDCHQLIIDPVASKVVQQMFQWAAEGAGINTIVMKLNEAGCLPPSLYKQSIDEFPGKVQHYRLSAGHWSSWSVNKILRSQVYVGDLVQGKSKIIDHQQVKAREDEYTIVQNTHEAIISRDQFDQVQRLLTEAGQKAVAARKHAFTPNPLKVKVFCGHCGRSLHRGEAERKKSDNVYAVTCLTRYRYDRNGCPGVHIYEHKLIAALTELLQKELDAVLGCLRLSADQSDEEQRRIDTIHHDIAACRKEIERLHGLKRGLYESLLSGVLTQEEYQFMRKRYDVQIEQQQSSVQAHESALTLLRQHDKLHSRLQDDAQLLRDRPELAVKVINRLIDRIEITHDRQITVFYSFADEVKAWMEAHSK